MSTTATISPGTQVDIVVRRKEDWPLSWSFSNGTTNIDLTGYTFSFIVNDLAGKTWINVTPTGNSSGLVTVTPSYTATGLPAGTYNYELNATPPSSTPRAWIYGKARVQTTEK
jgi:hypothetical protein